MAYGEPWTEADVITKQEIFDKVWTHFVVEGNPPSIVDDICVYRGPMGLKCAVGVLLTDEEANRLNNSDKIDSRHNKTVIPMRLQPHLVFLNALQVAHDTSQMSDGPGLRANLQRVALENDLRVPA